MNFLQQLKDVEQFDDACCDGATLYSLDEITKVATEVIAVQGGWLALLADEGKKLEDGWTTFALFEFASSRSDDSNVRVSAVFHGEGPTGSLREARHIYWGPDASGYTFYLPGKAVIEALQILSKYYDFD